VGVEQDDLSDGGGCHCREAFHAVAPYPPTSPEQEAWLAGRGEVTNAVDHHAPEASNTLNQAPPRFGSPQRPQIPFALQ
jgi:hypothetical protein